MIRRNICVDLSGFLSHLDLTVIFERIQTSKCDAFMTFFWNKFSISKNYLMRTGIRVI